MGEKNKRDESRHGEKKHKEKNRHEEKKGRHEEKSRQKEKSRHEKSNGHDKSRSDVRKVKQEPAEFDIFAATNGGGKSVGGDKNDKLRMRRKSSRRKEA